MNNEFDVNVNLKETGSSELTANAEKALGQIQKALGLVGQVAETYQKSMNTLLDQMAKQVSSVSNENRQLARMAAREQSMVRGGYDAAGRMRNVNAAAQTADVKNITEVLSAQMVNTFRSVLTNVGKSIESAAVVEMAKTRQSILSADANLAKAQIEAQRSRVALATAAGTGATSRGSIRQASNGLGITNLGDLRAEQAALDRLLASQEQITAQVRMQNAETRTFAGLNRQITNLTDERVTQTKEYIDSLRLAQRIAREEISLRAKQQLNDQAAVRSQEQKLANLRLRQMDLQGVRQESKEYQDQLAVLQRIANERAQIAELAKQTRQADAEDLRLQRSRDFAAGNGNQQEIVKNNIIGSRRAALSDEGRASLLALQAGLSVNYALIGGVGSAVSGSLQSIVDYDMKLRELQAIAGATEKEFNNLRTSILEVSEATKFSAVELTEGATQLAQAGLSVQEITNVLPKLADAAVATGSDFKTLSDIVTTTMTVFKQDSSQVGTILNVFTAALNTSKLSIDQLSAAFQYSANLAADSGVTYQELTAVIASMAQAGIKAGSMIGTGLRQAFAEFAAPSEKLVTLLGQLGLTMEDVNVKSQGVVGVLTNLREAGLTAEQAMAVFEKRTASAVIAAVNQSKYTEELTRNIILSSAAEEAAAKSKEALAVRGATLRNVMLSIVNDAAKPFVAILGDLATALTSVSALHGPLAVVVGLIGAFVAATTIMSLTKLVGELIRFSEVMTLLGPIITTAMAPFTAGRVAMQAFFVAMSGGIGIMTSLRVATIAFAESLGLLNINPVILALTALIGTLYAVSAAVDTADKQFDRLTKVIDDNKTQINALTAENSRYQTISDQVDGVIQRLIDRHANLTKGQDDTKNATQALSNLVLEAATSFNSMGATIDATGESFNSIMEKMQQFSLRIKQMQADVLNSSAAMNRTLGLNQRQAAGTGLARGSFSMGYLRAQLRAMGVDGKQADQIVGDASYLRDKSAGGGAALSANDALVASRLNRQVMELIPKTSSLRGNLTNLGGGNPLRMLSENLSAFTQNVTGALSAESNAVMQEQQGASLRIAADPAYQKRLREAGFDSNGSRNSSAYFADLNRKAQQDYLKTGDVAAYTRKREEILTQMETTFQKGEQTMDNLDKLIAGAKSPAEADRLMQDQQILRNRQQGLAGILRGDATRRDTSDKTNLPGVIQQIKGGRIDLAKKSLQDMGYDTSNMNASQLETFATRQLASAQRGARGIQYGNRLSPDDIIGIDIADRTNQASQSRRAAAAEARGARGAERTAQDSLKLAEDAAATLLSTAKGAMRQITTDLSQNILKNTTKADAQQAIAQASEEFEKAQDTVRQAYGDQIEAINEFIAARGSSLPADQLNSLREKIDALEVKRDQELQSNISKFENAINKVSAKVPELFKPITTVLAVLERTLSVIEMRFRDASNELNSLQAVQDAYGEISATDIATGRVGQGTMNVLNSRNNRAILEARRNAAAAQNTSNLSQLSAIGLTLDRRMAAPTGEVTSLREVGTGQNFEMYLQYQRDALATMKEGSVQAQAQSKWIDEIVSSQAKIVELTDKEVALRQQTTAYAQAQASVQQEQLKTPGQQLTGAANAYMTDQGMDKPFSLLETAVTNLPTVLGSAQNAFSQFFSSVMAGTASIGDAFQAMGRSILQSMMDIVASEAAKALLKLLIKIGTAIFSGGSGGGMKMGGPVLKRASGGSIPSSFAAWRGMVSGGTEGRDSVRTDLMPGEFVMRKSAVDFIGQENLEMMNTAGNRTMSKNASGKVATNNGTIVQQPFSIYMVSPDKVPPTSKSDIVMAVQDDMINKGAVYKSVRAITQGAI